MRVLIVGGGSGGHVTPALAVAREILKKKPRAKVEFWTDRKYYANVVKITTLGGEGDLNMKVRWIFAGKFHRYSGWKLKDYFKLINITVKDLIIGNILGFLGFLIGLLERLVLRAPKKRRPDVIFLNGGYVGRPVGLVAGWFKIPFVIHESDATPGLANRILMRKAKTVGMGVKFEATFKDEDGAEKSIPGREKWEWVGVPVSDEFSKVSAAKEVRLKAGFSFDLEKPLVVVTGGSQGSERLNKAMAEILPEMMKFASVGLVVGRKHYEKMVDLKKYEVWENAKLKSNFRMWEFNSNMSELLGAADVVVSRAGATTIAELAALKKAVILVPFADLPGAHQVKNAERLESAGAAKVVNDEEMTKKPEVLLEAVRELVRRPKEREKLAENLNKETKTGAAERLAEIVIEAGE